MLVGIGANYAHKHVCPCSVAFLQCAFANHDRAIIRIYSLRVAMSRSSALHEKYAVAGSAHLPQFTLPPRPFLRDPGNAR